MQDTTRRNRVFKSLHKPLTYFGVERVLFVLAILAAVLTFNLFTSMLAGFIVFAGGYGLGYWITKVDPAFLRIIGRSSRFRTRYDAAKQQFPNVEIR